jgi:CO dehydrogenase nickel-insertion accessory protein CooC1
MKRIIELTKEVELEFENIWILGNRFSDNLKEILENEVDSINETNVRFLGILPNDEEIGKINLIGENLLELSNQSKTYQSAQKLFAKIL